MRRNIVGFVLLLLCAAIIGMATQMPPAAPMPVSADAWVLTMTPSPPVGAIR